MSTRVTFGDLGPTFSESQRPENIDLKKIFLMPNKCKFLLRIMLATSPIGILRHPADGEI